MAYSRVNFTQPWKVWRNHYDFLSKLRSYQVKDFNKTSCEHHTNSHFTLMALNNINYKICVDIC